MTIPDWNAALEAAAQLADNWVSPNTLPRQSSSEYFLGASDKAREIAAAIRKLKKSPLSADEVYRRAMELMFEAPK